MAVYIKMYLPVLITCAMITAAYVLLLISNGGGIDPGPPNARV